ncbi:MAG: PQQ-binding-like beta-propeller repeat protein [Micromonosporaceae bacterium]|jgi:hypothetical protein
MSRASAWLRRLLWLLVAGLLSLLVVAGILPNPLPAIWEWINRERPLAPGMEWQFRASGRPSGAVAVGDLLVLAAGDQVQVRERLSGLPVVDGWDGEWLTVAGTGRDTAVITGRRMSRGYQVRDPATGAVIHEDRDARAVWGFRDARIDLRCAGPRSCELRGYRPRGDQPVWSAGLPGAGPKLVGPDPPLGGVAPEVPTPVEPLVAAPPPLPRLIGVPLDRDRLVVVHTGTGEVLSQVSADRGEIVLVVGERVLRSTVTRQDGICRPAVTAYDPATGASAWGPEPYHLRTVTGGGCEQRGWPTGAGAVLVAVGPDGSELVVDANDGRVLWRGEPGERVQAVSERLAVVRTADGAVRYGVALGGDGSRLWEHPAHEDAGVVLAGCGVVVADRDPGRIRVWDPDTGEEVTSVLTSARLLACARDGLVLSEGRSVGFLPFPGVVTPSDSPPQPDREPRDPPPPPPDVK